ncbi:glycosyltransferase family 4 protein [Aeromonas hydrophila]|uniref:glycosyltransferase family 4 protein n=1 Tax=Aeromonas hydrophila TaxID=644 RepID=UPI00107E6C8B|nr:glycosyltransferase family 4 protein [Aeromonas hydrophila]QBX70762.1 glycosyltransferase family 1 protein [Aeromonas hydrophila]QBX75487.1 glycosyltransferase family 1 protein [Aeromonas hydrophila]WDA25900.1 glycosyltransferase family 4 protein [Aeromonas hydrophila]WES91777.1 glycosyltransferase family 4 protein [Aeromonas hydrophila]
MRIVISANTSWYLYNFRKNTILSLLENGDSVYILAPRDKHSELLISLGASYYDVYIDQGGANPLKDIFSFFIIWKFLYKIKPDVLLNFTPKNNIYGSLAAGLLGVRVINNVAGLGGVFLKDNITSKIVKILYRMSFRCVEKIFFQNLDDMNIFLNNKIVHEENIERLPGSGVDLNRFNYVPSEESDIVKFLLIARMLYDKGIEHYVESARILKLKYGERVEFNMLGFLDVNNPSAVTQEMMQSWVEEGVVNYFGVSDQVENEIEKADCVVLPSFYREGVPKSLLEAGAMGKPIVTTDNVGCRETVEHGVNGYLCEPRSTESLTLMLERMINLSHQDRLKMGYESRRKIAREFDEKIIIEKYISAIYKTL